MKKSFLNRTTGTLFQAFVPLADVSQSSKLGQLYQNSTDLAGFVSGLFKFAIVIGAMVAIIRLVYAGYLYMGSDMWSSKGKAKEVIGDVVLGILLLLAVWLILYQINPDILNLKALRQVQSHPTNGGATSGGTTNTGGTNTGGGAGAF